MTKKEVALTLKWLGGGGVIWPSCSFSKNVFSRKTERLKSWLLFFCFLLLLFFLILSYSRSFLKISLKFQIPPSRSEGIKTLSLNDNYFHWFFGFFDIPLMQRRQHIIRQLINSEYNRSYQHFFTLNLGF